MISHKNILFIGDPYCIHNLKWITYFSLQNRCLIIGAVTDYSNKTEHTEKIIHDNNIRVFEEPLPEFSVKRFMRTNRALKRLDKIIADNKIDFVHIMYGTNIPWGYRLSKPLVLTTRGSDVLIDLPRFFGGYNGPLWERIYTRIVKKLAFITSTSAQQAERIQKLFPDFPKEKIHVIRTGVNVEDIIALETQIQVKRDANRILLARYVAPNYNNELILKAIQLLPAEVRKQLTLVLLSPIKIDRVYFTRTMEFANSLGCTVELKQEMSQREMWTEFYKAAMCVMTPLSDGTPNTALEAMSAKCPLVLPPLPYDPGLFDGVTMRLNAYSEQELAEVITACLNGKNIPDLEKGRERVRKEGSRSDMMDRLNQQYKILTGDTGEVECTRCVLSNFDDPAITFDQAGVCSHCRRYDKELPEVVLSGEKGMQRWQAKVAELKRRGQGKKYDCILGISGGTDSTYLALKAKESGLRVLCVHLDNGWNSKEASSNIKNIIRKLEIDLFTYVVDWEEFKDIQKAYFKAGVLDLDVPTDHAMLACLYDQAIKHKIKYILSGHNYVTEAILPANFNFDKGDAQNLINIHAKFGKVPIKTFPLFRQKEKYLVSRIHKLISIRPLNWIDYNKDAAKKEIIEKLGWKDYGAKHYENIFTRFYQGYILPRRFGIDKRKAHLATLICSGQITKAQAEAELLKPAYDPAQLEIDKQFVLNKFGWSETEFENLMTLPIVPHEEYGIEKPWSHYLGIQYFRRKK
ncbi:MAG: N-acetyl sugar amidotransferase [Bacteroidetes bacterium]|nr:N-acetyl sugar amidotransferase [Bacteroidota bacterium]